MEFYTSVVQYGSKMLVRGIDARGFPFKRREEFKPTIFVPAKTQTQFKTLEGKYVAPLECGTIRDTKEYIESYKDVQGFEIYGNMNWIAQYISDHYQNEIIHDSDKIKLFTIDIETKTELGFPDIATANEEIILISIQDNKTKQITTFGSKPYVHSRDDVTYKYFDTESRMLKEFIIW
jgi:hypothetical protein